MPSSNGWLDSIMEVLSPSNPHPGDSFQRLAGKAGGALSSAVLPTLLESLPNATGLRSGAEDTLSRVADPTFAELFPERAQGGGQAEISPSTPEAAAASEQRLQDEIKQRMVPASVKKVGEVAGSMAGDPTNLAALAVTAAAPELAPAVSGLFGASMLKGTSEAVDKGNWGEAALNAAMAGLTLGHSVGSVKGTLGKIAADDAVSAAAKAPMTLEESLPPVPRGSIDVKSQFMTPEVVGDTADGWAPWKKNPHIGSIENPKASNGVNFETPSGKYFTMDIMKDNPVDAVEGMKYARNAARNPNITNALGDMVDFGNDILGEAKQDGLYANIENAMKARDPLAQILPEATVGEPEVRGISFGRSGQYGHTYPLEVHRALLDNGKRAVWINARNNALTSKANVDWLIDSPTEPGLLKKAMDTLSPEDQQYVAEVRGGGVRSPEIEDRIASKMFADRVVYTVLHEGHSHWGPSTYHAEGHPSYRNALSDVTGTSKFEMPPNQVTMYPQNVNPAEMGLSPEQAATTQRANMTDFEPGHNAIVTALNDPGRLQAMKTMMSTPEFQQRAMSWYKASLGDGEWLGQEMVKQKAGRIVGRPEQKAAAAEFADEQLPPTPPSGLPPDPAGGEPMGPELQPLSERIKIALDNQGKVVAENESRMRNLKAIRAQALRENTDNYNSHVITPEQYAERQKEIMSGKYGLRETIDRMPLTEEERIQLTDQIAQESQYEEFERFRAQAAFEKLVKGERLQDNEITTLKKTLLTREEQLKEDPLYKRMGEFFVNATGSSRALMTSWDLSAAGRQGLFASVMNPREAGMAFKAQIKALAMTHDEFEAFMGRLRDPIYNPYTEIADAAGLHFSETMEKNNPLTMEEAFYKGKWAEKVPLVRRTEQAYIAYLNKLRVELFNKSVQSLERSNTPLLDANGGVTQEVKDVAYMVNTLTGRGEMSLFHLSKNAPAVKGLSKVGLDLGIKEVWNPGEASMKNMHQALTTGFFAPRFAASRAAILRDASMALVGGNLSPKVYAMYMKNVIGTTMVMGSVAGSLAAMGVGTFQVDPRKKDFGVLKVGNVRYDLFGGLKPWVKLVAVMETDKYWSGRSGLAKKYGQLGNRTKTGELGRFVQGKLSPPASLLVEAITGEDYFGKKSTAWTKAYSHMTPMLIQTIVEAIQANEADQLAVAIPASALGFGVNSYDERQLRKRNQ